jgi:asparagine synthase (glutamine-hydrolysing)
MCGIAGFVGDRRPGLVEAMNRVQRHRGPDGDGVYSDRDVPATLGHVRLSILDLSNAASQPMISSCARYVLSYNGELYNYADLKRQLDTPRQGWRTTGDTEVLLEGLAQRGGSFLGQMNGMFAFALWDSVEKSLMLVRDQLGIKPIYYATPRAGSLIFASEMKALFAYGLLKREVNFFALQEHLAFGHASGEHTAIQGVFRIPPGACLRWSIQKPAPSISRYWQARFRPATTADRTHAVEELRDGIRASVLRQLVSDVPVGSFLSGGLDSTLISKIAVEQKEDIKLYTSVIPPADNSLDQMPDDAPYAREFAAVTGMPLTEVPICSRDIANLPKLVWHLDEPIADPAVINCYLLSRIAQQDGVKVLLSGQGADELFGGYPRYRAMQIASSLSRLPGFLQWMLRCIGNCTPGGVSGRFGATMRRFRRIATAIGLGFQEQFLNYCCGAPPQRVHRIFSPNARGVLMDRMAVQNCLDHMIDSGLDGIDGCLERDLSVYLPNHNLMYTDKMGMAVGVETRVPLIDMEVTNLVVPFPAEWKVGKRGLKILLREAARGIIPEEFISRRKAGFAAPYRFWLRNELKDLWEDCASERSIRHRGWYDPKEIHAIRRESQVGASDHYLLQWGILTAELWARSFLDANPANEHVVH